MKLRYPSDAVVDAPASGVPGDDDRADAIAPVVEWTRAPRQRLIPATRAALRQHRRAVTATVLIVLAGTTAGAFALPQRYSAHADLWLDHGFDTVAGSAAGRTPNPLSRNTEIRVVTSNDVAAAVVEKLGLANVRGIGQPAQGALIPADRARLTAIDVVRNNLRVVPSGNSYAVGVDYSASAPVLAAGILNQLLDSYVEDRKSGGVLGRRQQQMRAEVATARDAAMRARAEYAGFRAASSFIHTAEDEARVRRDIAALEDELKIARARQRAAEMRLGPIRARDGDGKADVSSPRLRDLRAQQAELKAGRATGGQSAVPTDLRLALINRDLDLETRRAAGLVTGAREARERAEAIDAARVRLREALRARTEAGTQLAKLNEGAIAAQGRFDLLSQQYARETAAQRVAPGTAYVIARAVPGSARRSPDPWLIALAGILVAILAAAIVVAILEALVKGFRSRHQLERELGLPVIGMVPNLARTPDADLAADDPMGPPDYLYNHPRSAFATAFRSIHMGLRLGSDAHSPRSIAVCSALQEEGKTTVAISLARSAAMAGLRVVLVDCDARRPAASRALSPYVGTGLVDVLTRGVDYRQAVQRDTPSGAWFLGQRTDTQGPLPAIDSKQMAQLIAMLAHDFDLVILDTPPVLALVEARAVAAMADGVLLVARARTTPVGAARIAQETLLRAGAKISGATLTLVDP